jgi:hypothetical protein
MHKALGSSPALKKRRRRNKERKVRHWWLMPIILATWEAEIRRIAIPGQPGMKKHW